jgi:hypothetical protein
MAEKELKHLEEYLRNRVRNVGGFEKDCDWSKGYNGAIQDMRLFFLYENKNKE